MSDWYCVSATSRKELLAFDALESVGFKTYFPKIITGYKENKDSKEKTPIIVPAFPKYLIVLANADNLLTQIVLWRQIRYMTGIERVISVAGEPIPINYEFIDFMIRNIDPITHVLNISALAEPTPETTFELNEEVKFKTGSFSYFSNALRIHKLNGPGRVAILWKALGRDNIIENVDANLLEKVT